MKVILANLRHDEQNDWSNDDDAFLIDRRTPVGNPFILENADDDVKRDEVCDKYEEWFHKEGLKNERVQKYLDKLLEHLKSHGRLVLLCWCIPKRCHGETIKRWIESEILQKGE